MPGQEHSHSAELQHNQRCWNVTQNNTIRHNYLCKWMFKHSLHLINSLFKRQNANLILWSVLRPLPSLLSGRIPVIPMCHSWRGLSSSVPCPAAHTLYEAVCFFFPRPPHAATLMTFSNAKSLSSKLFFSPTRTSFSYWIFFFSPSLCVWNDPLHAVSMNEY